MIRHYSQIFSLALVLALAGCASESAVDEPTTSSGPTAEGAAYLVSEPPADAQDVIAMREGIADAEDVVVVGRIGGSHNPWVEGVAAFTLVDRSLPACTDIPGDTCPTPWDYCCATDKLPGATTLVKVVDEQGQVVSTGAKELLGVSELQTVVVQGTAQKDDAGNISVLADRIYVDPHNPGQVPRGDAGHDHDHDHDHDHQEAESEEDHGGDAAAESEDAS
jgi:hypothetical protein